MTVLLIWIVSAFMILIGSALCVCVGGFCWGGAIGISLLAVLPMTFLCGLFSLEKEHQ